MTTIGTSLILTGDLTSDEDLLIDGRVRGAVSVRNATLTIGEQARLESDVRGARVIVRGTVLGSIAATERIELQASATVSGNLSANHVVIEEGARFDGRIDMDQRTIAAKVAQFRATAEQR